MLSREQEQKLDDTRKHLAQIKSEFKALIGIPWKKIEPNDPALLDLTSTLQSWYNEAKNKADTELDDPIKTMVYLREANTYDKIMSYIDKQLSQQYEFKF